MLRCLPVLFLSIASLASTTRGHREPINITTFNGHFLVTKGVVHFHSCPQNMTLHIGRWKELEGRPTLSNRFVGNKLSSKQHQIKRLLFALAIKVILHDTFQARMHPPDDVVKSFYFDRRPFLK
ncbi:hypothetical protein KCU62_g486, partial [Aureobasidium sp. EXF-3399]